MKMPTNIAKKLAVLALLLAAGPAPASANCALNFPGVNLCGVVIPAQRITGVNADDIREQAAYANLANEVNALPTAIAGTNSGFVAKLFCTNKVGEAANALNNIRCSR